MKKLVLFCCMVSLASFAADRYFHAPGLQSDGTLSNGSIAVFNEDGTLGDGSGQSNATTQTSIVLPTNSFPYKKGQLSFDTDSNTILADTGYDGVRVNIGQEVHVPIYNGLIGTTLSNGTPVAGSGLYFNGIPNVIPADADNELHVIGYLGVATADIPFGEMGLATYIGAIRDVDTSGLAVAPAFLASGGGFQNAVPLYPTARLLIGGVTASDAVNGVVGTLPIYMPRTALRGAYSFTSQGIGAGTYYKAGFYEWETSDTTLNQGSLTETLGTAGAAKAARPGIVVSGAGTVDTGQVGLRVIGIGDSETGIQTASVTNIITTNITELATDILYESDGKMSGQVTYELYTVTGSPTTYSLTFNYGWSKYEDFGDQDFTVSDIDAVWQGNANSTLDIALMHHTVSNWTYAATGFAPGNGDIARKSIDQQLAGDAENNFDGSWKHKDLNLFIDGNGGEGFVIEIITGANNTIQTMDINVAAYSEELTR